MLMEGHVGPILFDEGEERRRKQRTETALSYDGQRSGNSSNDRPDLFRRSKPFCIFLETIHFFFTLVECVWSSPLSYFQPFANFHAFVTP